MEVLFKSNNRNPWRLMLPLHLCTPSILTPVRGSWSRDITSPSSNRFLHFANYSVSQWKHIPLQPTLQLCNYTQVGDKWKKEASLYHDTNDMTLPPCHKTKHGLNLAWRSGQISIEKTRNSEGEVSTNPVPLDGFNPETTSQEKWRLPRKMPLRGGHLPSCHK